MYSKKVIGYFKHPKFVGEIKNADGIGQNTNPLCGDIMKLYLKITKNKQGKEVIKNIKFQTFGCVVAIASTEALCRLIKGKTLNEAQKITNKDILKKLGTEVPKIKVHCSFLAAEALRNAIKDYEKKKVRN